MFKYRNQGPPSYNSIFQNNSNNKKKLNANATSKQTDQQQLNEPISYELFMKTRKHLVQEQANLQQQYEASNRCRYLPVKYIVIHLLLLAFLSIIFIGLQVVAIDRNEPYYYVGAGIWIGVYNLFLIIFTLITCKFYYIYAFMFVFSYSHFLIFFVK